MLGEVAGQENRGSDGIMVLTLRDLFLKIHETQAAPREGGATTKFKVTCSFLEVYNEMIRDLLTPSSEYLDLREDPVKGPTVMGKRERCRRITPPTPLFV